MEVQIELFSPHQNAKVFAVLMAVSSPSFLIPFGLFAFASAPAEIKPPLWWFVGMPLFYLVFGYITVGIGRWFYNTMFRYIGGVEFTLRNNGV